MLLARPRVVFTIALSCACSPSFEFARFGVASLCLAATLLKIMIAISAIITDILAPCSPAVWSSEVGFCRWLTRSESQLELRGYFSSCDLLGWFLAAVGLEQLFERAHRVAARWVSFKTHSSVSVSINLGKCCSE